MRDRPVVQFVNHHRKSIVACMMLLLVVISGIHFTFVFPYLSGFTWSYFLFVVVPSYFSIAAILSVSYPQSSVFVGTSSFICSALGMGWRLFIEWGENSLLDYMNPITCVSYPFIITFIMIVSYLIIEKSRTNIHASGQV